MGALKNMTPEQLFEHTLNHAKREVIMDIERGKLPGNLTHIKSFDELHQYVDANCYGGFCDDFVWSFLWIYFDGDPDEISRDHEIPAEMVSFITKVQTALITWLTHRIHIPKGRKIQTCYVCQGSGYTGTDQHVRRCAYCNGTGTIFGGAPLNE